LSGIFQQRESVREQMEELRDIFEERSEKWE